MSTVILATLALAALTLVIRHFSWHRANFANVLVRDGDSIRITGAKAVEFRLSGYDAPEWNQAYGTQATKALKSLLKDGFQWKVVDYDDYGRVVIKARNARGSVARQMVLGGHAHNSSNLGFYEFIARITRRGLWAGKHVIRPATHRALNTR